MTQQRFCEDCKELKKTRPVWDDQEKDYLRKCFDCEPKEGERS